jgi:hypothetical protein
MERESSAVFPLYIGSLNRFNVLIVQANGAFQKLCLTLADETAPRKIALLKQRLRLMLLTEEKQS